MPILQLALLFVSGVITGIFSGVFGVGGGVIIVPLLVFFFGYTQISATATSLVALLLPVGLLSVREFYLNGKLTPNEIKTGLIIAIGLFFGAYFGAKIALSLPENTLRKSFAVFLMAIAAKLWWV
jgi:uncharacterized membrane protein YfcA